MRELDDVIFVRIMQLFTEAVENYLKNIFIVHVSSNLEGLKDSFACLLCVTSYAVVSIKIAHSLFSE